MPDAYEITDIHQIIIVDNYQTPRVIPEPIHYNADCARALYPRASYKMWNGDDLRVFIARHFDRDVLWAFDTLVPYSYKCDLARFCLLHEIGGLYIDLGVRLVARWPIPDRFAVASFRDISFLTNSWPSMQTGLLWSKPGRREFEIAIRFIVENCRARYYGDSPLHPTGPVLLGKAMISATAAIGPQDDADDQAVGECRCITRDGDLWNVAYISAERSLIALRTKIVPGDISHLGVEGANNYNELWRARRVYGERAQLYRRWAPNDPGIKLVNAQGTQDGLFMKKGQNGTISFDMTNVMAGRYSLHLHVDRRRTNLHKIHVVTKSVSDDEVLGRATRRPSLQMTGWVNVPFIVTKPAEHVRISISGESLFQGVFDDVILKRRTLRR